MNLRAVNDARRALRRLRREDGNSLVEMACILPTFFLVTFGFINFALVIYGMGNANFASRAALRFVTLHSSTSFAPTTQSDLQKLVSPYMLGYPANTYSITSAYNGGNLVGSQCSVTVTVTYTITMLGYTFRDITYRSTGSGVVLQ